MKSRYVHQLCVQAEIHSNLLNRLSCWSMIYRQPIELNEDKKPRKPEDLKFIQQKIQTEAEIKGRLH